MKRARSLASLAVMATALMAITVPSASAADTAVTFELAGDVISVSAQPTAALTPGNSGATQVSGPLGDVVVTDNRGGTVGWSVGAATTTFTDGTTSDVGVSYDSGLPGTTGMVVATSSGATALSATPAEVVAGTLVVGNNTATWNPTLTVALPASSTAGSYTGTITTSLL